ncbi:glycosyltransferase [Rhizobium sp. P44RR-XXIV]|uniref:glycosyltransferase n=1 Tax=Rhizobium sp. P44RR-XXIV TaxID=1921145 RepID=UPI0009857A95|nr:glycosyltransferase [Rhizobium sp. P44RR-XXIV]TIX87104.1 glycosyltransferase family 4 protein [Rhizobium sp. P44RR-XXIV]
MKILLLSDIPPCDNYTAGLVLSAMVRFVPRDGICCFAVVNAGLDIRTTSEFANIPTEIHAKPNENWSWLPKRRFIRKVSSLVSLAGEFFIERTAVRSLIDKAVAFGREQNVDRVWAVLQGQTTIRMAQSVADKLGVPLHTHVWDPFSWWAKANRIDGLTSRRVQSLFDQAIQNSRCIATASEPMAQLYRDRFKVNAVPVISSHARSMAHFSEVVEDKRRPILIGMAGQFYAAGEWLQLLRAMQSSGWTIAGRPVRIVVLGPQRPPGGVDAHISFLGWKSQPDAASVLSQCDLLYCPYPFDPGMKEVSLYSFPSKLVLYLAAGRPIVFHGPAYSAPAHYIKSRQCGLVAEKLNASAIYNELERLISNPDGYRSMALNAHAAFLKDFTLESMERAFNAFIGASTVEDTDSARLQNHADERGAANFVAAQLAKSERYTSSIWLARTVGSAIRRRRAHFRVKMKGLLRRLVLKVPRMRSLHHEMHALYAEKASLKRQIARLEYENTRLNVMQARSSVDPNNEVAQHRLIARVSASVAAPQMISTLYPDTQTLVLTSFLDDLKPIFTEHGGENLALDDRQTHFTVGAVNYAQAPSLVNFDIRPGDDWAGIYASLPPKIITSLSRFVLQEGFERLVVSDEDVGRIALAAAAARLISLRLTVIFDAQKQPSARSWLVSQDHIDLVDAALPEL